jgi:membrane-bound ClpP family serine protease
MGKLLMLTGVILLFVGGVGNASPLGITGIALMLLGLFIAARQPEGAKVDDQRANCSSCYGTGLTWRGRNICGACGGTGKK